MKNARAAGWLLAAFASGVTPAHGQQWGGVPVLMYHRVDAVVPADAVGRDLTVEPQAFEAQLQFLRARGIASITAEALARAITRGLRPQRAVVLTFDDGYEEVPTTTGERLPWLLLPILVICTAGWSIREAYRCQTGAWSPQRYCLGVVIAVLSGAAWWAVLVLLRA